MDTLLRFGSGDELYTFTPDNQISIRDNFANVVPRTTRLPGADGGFDEFGRERAPGEIGNVQMIFWLYASSLPAMTAVLDELRAMTSWGTKRLYKQPMGGGGDRWCEARLNSIDAPQNASDLPGKRQRVQLNFQVASPFWLNQGTEAFSWGDGTPWGDGIWGGSAAANAVSGTDTSFTVTTSGNAISHPRITIECGGGQTASNIRIRRIVQGETVDEVAYAGTLTAGDELEINCRDLSVTLNGANAYDSDFTFQTASWFRLLPGANTIQVLMDNSGDAADVYFRYYEVFK